MVGFFGIETRIGCTVDSEGRLAEQDGIMDIVWRFMVLARSDYGYHMAFQWYWQEWFMAGFLFSVHESNRP